MVYHYEPGDPCSNPKNGLGEVCAFPSPRYFMSFPKYNFLDHTGKENRGYTAVFKLLVGKKLISKIRLRKLIPNALDTCRVRPEVKKNESNVPEVPLYDVTGKRMGSMPIR